MKGNNENEIVAGLLHDVVEDTDYTFEDLLAAGISQEVVDALRLLTHEKGSNYMDYVERIAQSHNPIAINVKCNDLDHNLDRGRKGDHLAQVAKHSAARPNSLSKSLRNLSRMLPPKLVSPLTSTCNSSILTVSKNKNGGNFYTNINFKAIRLC